jgi:hypothetical protein
VCGVNISFLRLLLACCSSLFKLAHSSLMSCRVCNPFSSLGSLLQLLLWHGAATHFGARPSRNWQDGGGSSHRVIMGALTCVWARRRNPLLLGFEHRCGQSLGRSCQRRCVITCSLTHSVSKSASVRYALVTAIVSLTLPCRHALPRFPLQNKYVCSSSASTH